MEARLLALLALLLLGCALPTTPGRESEVESRSSIQRVVRQYLEAIYTGRAREAWELHSQATNQGESFEVFAQVVTVAATVAAEAKIERMGEPVVNGDQASIEVVQRLGESTSRHEFSLVRERGLWRIHNPRGA